MCTAGGSARACLPTKSVGFGNFICPKWINGCAQAMPSQISGANRSEAQREDICVSLDTVGRHLVKNRSCLSQGSGLSRPFRPLSHCCASILAHVPSLHQSTNYYPQSDNQSDICSNRAIESGRYLVFTPVNQRHISTIRDQAWAIEVEHVTACPPVRPPHHRGSQGHSFCKSGLNL